MLNSTNSEMLIEKDSRPSGVEVSAKVCYTDFEVPNKPHDPIVMLGLTLENSVWPFKYSKLSHLPNNLNDVKTI